MWEVPTLTDVKIVVSLLCCSVPIVFTPMCTYVLGILFFLRELFCPHKKHMLQVVGQARKLLRILRASHSHAKSCTLSVAFRIVVYHTFYSIFKYKITILSFVILWGFHNDLLPLLCSIRATDVHTHVNLCLLKIPVEIEVF